MKIYRLKNNSDKDFSFEGVEIKAGKVSEPVEFNVYQRLLALYGDRFLEGIEEEIKEEEIEEAEEVVEKKVEVKEEEEKEEKVEVKKTPSKEKSKKSKKK